MFERDLPIDLDDCRLLSVTTTGSTVARAWRGEGPLVWHHDRVDIEVAPRRPRPGRLGCCGWPATSWGPSRASGSSTAAGGDC
jgi:hypothetical protein